MSVKSKKKTPQTGEGDIYMNVSFEENTLDERTYMNTEEVSQVSVLLSLSAILFPVLSYAFNSLMDTFH